LACFKAFLNIKDYYGMNRLGKPDLYSRVSNEPNAMLAGN
jgi:hypothetical protein